MAAVYPAGPEPMIRQRVCVSVVFISSSCFVSLFNLFSVASDYLRSLRKALGLEMVKEGVVER